MKLPPIRMQHENFVLNRKISDAPTMPRVKQKKKAIDYLNEFVEKTFLRDTAYQGHLAALKASANTTAWTAVLAFVAFAGGAALARSTSATKPFCGLGFGALG